jgi:hypothetical protein
MKPRSWLALALLAIAPFGIHAQEAAPPNADAYMEAMMKAGTPGDPHKALAVMEGTWNTTVKAWMAPGAEPMTSEGVSEMKMVLGGRYLHQTFKGNFGGMPFEGLGYTGYDNVKKQYWGTWMDNMSTAMMSSKGEMSEGGAMTFSGTMTDPMTGEDQPVKEKIRMEGNDRIEMEMWGPGPDGKMFKTMEIVYTRKK